MRVTNMSTTGSYLVAFYYFVDIRNEYNELRL